MKNKLFAAANLTVSLMLVSACGVSPSAPSELPSMDSQAVTPSSTISHTSGKPTTQPPANCAVGIKLTLQPGSSGRGFVEAVSNYPSAARACLPLVWSLEPTTAARLVTERFAGKGEGLRVYRGASSLTGVGVVAKAPDGQVARIQLSFNGAGNSEDTLALASESTALTSRGRQILPPPTCATGDKLTLQVGSRGKAGIEVVSNYLRAARTCPALSWRLGPSVGSEALVLEPFARPEGEAVRILDAGRTQRSVLVIATAPDGQVAKLRVDLKPGLAPRG